MEADQTENSSCERCASGGQVLTTTDAESSPAIDGSCWIRNKQYLIHVMCRFA